MITITDNYLKEIDLQTVQQFYMGRYCPWAYIEGIDYPDDGKSHFVHFIHYDHMWINGPGPIAPIIDKINPSAICKIKANMLMPTNEIELNSFHVDQQPAEKFTTSIFYINSNDGYTEFEDGTKVESIANRLVTFPSNIQHRGTTATDSRRLVINFNYVK